MIFLFLSYYILIDRVLLMEYNYKFNFVTKEKDKQIFFEKYNTNLLQLFKKCYDASNRMTIDDFKKFENIFVCTLNDNIIGFVSVSLQQKVFYTNEEIDSYYALKYVKVENISDGILIRDTFNKKPNELETRTIGPCIEYICKDHVYEHVGSFLLVNIEKYYKDRNYEHIYIIIDNTSKLNELYSAVNSVDIFKQNTLDYAHIVSLDYKQTQIDLMRYYEKHGYLILENYFDSDCSFKTGSHVRLRYCMFLNIMIKDL